MTSLEKTEFKLLLAVLGLFALAVLGPAAFQPAHHHDFADQRVWSGIPFAMDVLSNAAFALAGLAGAAILLMLRPLHKQHQSTVERWLAAVFFGGLLLTAVGSAWYHWQPDDTGLALDRLGMVAAFAGLMGMVTAGRASHRAGWAITGAVLLLGPWSIGYWLASGNVLPWVVLQFGGMTIVTALAFAKPLPNALAIRWGWVIAIYAVAKMFELADHAVFELTRQMVSGHSIKHIIASLAALPVCLGLLRLLAEADPNRLPNPKTADFQAQNKPQTQ